MLSYYSMIIAYAFFIIKTQFGHQVIPTLIYDTIAAIAIVIALAVGFYYVQYGVVGAQKFYGGLLGVDPPLPFTVLFDVFVHFLPPFLLGLPRNPIAFVWAYLVILAWYVIIRNDFIRIYEECPCADFVDKAIFTTLPLVLAIFALITQGMRSTKK